MRRPYRVVVAKPGLDGHDRGAKVIARSLRDAGFEVIYTGLHQSPLEVVSAVIQEDADVLGLSMLSGAHLSMVPAIMQGLRAADAADVLVVAGGIIPPDDAVSLKAMGVAEIFTPGARLPVIVSWLEEQLDTLEDLKERRFKGAMSTQMSSSGSNSSSKADVVPDHKRGPDPQALVKVAVLASGSGTILSAMLAEALPISVVAVDRPCGAQQVAQRHNVALLDVMRDRFDAGFDRRGYTERLVSALLSHDIGLVAMAGFGTVLSSEFFEAFAGKVLNTHPALLPAFKGWHAVQAAIDAQVSYSGCTVHVATPLVDDGPILAQQRVPVLPGDTAETLHERIKQVERCLYPATVRAVLDCGGDPAALVGRSANNSPKRDCSEHDPSEHDVSEQSKGKL